MQLSVVRNLSIISNRRKYNSPSFAVFWTAPLEVSFVGSLKVTFLTGEALGEDFFFSTTGSVLEISGFFSLRSVSAFIIVDETMMKIYRDALQPHRGEIA